MEPLAFYSIKIKHMMRRLKRALFLYRENITLNIKILVSIVSNHFPLRKTTLKPRVMRYLLRSDVEGEEFVRFPLDLIGKTFQKWIYKSKESIQGSWLRICQRDC